MQFITFDVLDSKGKPTGEQQRLPVSGDVDDFLAEWNELFPNRKLQKATA